MNDDEFATCPYNVSHRVPRSRLQHHLVKCQKSNPGLWICPFNATHRCPEHLKQNHYNTCPDRPIEIPLPKAKEAQNGTIGAITKPKPLLQKDYLPEDDPDCEYWD
ncbi:hypothetical protein PYW07_013371 [Mythimna separata]|uniref:CHHC U11-48K-type domain-containing protein n=1 Tax=Mythimna separata TaxID=271217 RepID=A0AAD8DJI9_MYTSE|nr:hypothetical protein PYW07_013371 [Mythimna separata]